MSHALFDLNQKRVLVTGSSRGLGLAIARGLAEAGAHVILNGTDKDRLRQTQEGLQQEGHACAAYACDVRDEEQVHQTVSAIARDVGPIDVLVNNVGIHRRAPLLEQDPADWDAVLDVNLTAAWRVSRIVAPGMIERRAGKIVNIASLQSFAARPTTGSYAAAKGGLVMLTKAMAVEWGPYNVQANAIAPGYFHSDLTAPLAENPDFDAWVKMRSPANRWGEPHELVGPAVFLASDASSYVNGQVICVDGGWMANC